MLIVKEILMSPLDSSPDSDSVSTGLIGNISNRM